MTPTAKKTLHTERKKTQNPFLKRKHLIYIIPLKSAVIWTKNKTHSHFFERGLFFFQFWTLWKPLHLFTLITLELTDGCLCSLKEWQSLLVFEVTCQCPFRVAICQWYSAGEMRHVLFVTFWLILWYISVVYGRFMVFFCLL